jgi:phenylalanyl-tRNA synthetase beta chain
LEFGQPLHIFNYDAIAQKKIIVNSQTAFLTLETLDDSVRPIPPEALLICDAEKPLAFAGVMGGKSSAVTEETQDVLIESAYFTAQAIRKSSKWLSLRTEAAQRFEKGIDPNGVLDALDYAAYRLQEVAGGQIAPGIIDQKAHEFVPKKIACRIARINALLGTHISQREAASCLTRLGMQIEEHKSEWIVSVPTYRNDISIEEDLIEEVARLYGYNHIQQPIPMHASSTVPHAQTAIFEAQMRQMLIGEGLQEFLNCDLISVSQEEMLFESTLQKESCITVLHAKSAEQSVMRSSLLAGLLQVVKYNIDHYQRDIAGCEIGRVYFKQNGAFKEQAAAGIILSGKRVPYHWNPKPEEFDFFDLKGMIENIFSGLKIARVTFDPSHLHNFHPGRQAHVKVNDVVIGAIGEVHPKHIEKLDIGQRVYFAEWNLNELFSHLSKTENVIDPPLYPGSERDWTVTLKDEVPIQRVFDVIYRMPSRLLEKVSLLDLYKSDQIGKDKKNATFRFFYRDIERTLAFETVEREHARIIQTVAEALV